MAKNFFLTLFRPWARGQSMRAYVLQSVVQVLILLFLYVLSIGPFFWYWHEAFYVDGSKFWVAFYFPLLVACEVDFIRDFVNWYIGLWIF